MRSKKVTRLRRARRSRIKMREIGAIRLCVHRTPKHIYAQLLNSEGNQVLTHASTLEESLRSSNTGNVEAAKKVGELVAQRAKEIGVTKVAFDRSGFLYHGRVKALAEAARQQGLVF